MAGCGLSQNLWTTKPTWIEAVDVYNFGFTTIDTTEKSLHMKYFTNSNPNTPYDEFILRL